MTILRGNMQNPGKSFSIKGRLISLSTETEPESTLSFKFELHTYTEQV